MAVGSGLSTSIGWGVESTVGTAVTPTVWAEPESVKPTHQQIVKVVNGLRAGSLTHKARNRVLVGKMPTLATTLPIMSKGLGKIFKQCLGSATSALIASSTNRQIHLLADTTGLSLTVQAGMAESYSGTVRPYTYNGCKVTDWEISCSTDDYAKLALTLDAWNWNTATALTAPTYLTGHEVFHGAEMTVSIGGTATTATGRTTVASNAVLKGVRGVSVKGGNPMRTDRLMAGGAGIKSEQIRNDFVPITAEFDMEFADRTQALDLADAGTTTPIVITWVGVTSDAGNFPTLRLTIPQAKIEPSQPESGGPDINDGKITVTAYDDDAGSNPAFQLEYETTDSSI